MMKGTPMNKITYAKNADNIVILSADLPAQTSGIIGDDFCADLQAAVDHLESEREGIAGVILNLAAISSNGDESLSALFKMQPADVERLYEETQQCKIQLRRL